MSTTLFDQGLKECSGCTVVKPLDEFHVLRRAKSGRQPRCKECHCAARRAAYWADPEKAAEQNRGYRQRNRKQVRERKIRHYQDNLLAEKLRRGKNRAANAGLPAEQISAEELLADWQRRGIDPDRCVYTGRPLESGWHLDHVYPLSLKGTPGHVVSNLAPANPAQNRRKYRRHLIDYLADRAAGKVSE